MTTEMTLILLHRLFSAVNQGRLGAVDHYLAPNFQFHDPSYPAALDRAACLEVVGSALRASPGLRVTIEDEVVADERVALRYAACGAVVTDAHGRATIHRGAKATGILLARCDGGRLHEVWHIAHLPGSALRLALGNR